MWERMMRTEPPHAQEWKEVMRIRLLEAGWWVTAAGMNLAWTEEWEKRAAGMWMSQVGEGERETRTGAL